jgi:hypothetical protein
MIGLTTFGQINLVYKDQIVEAHEAQINHQRHQVGEVRRREGLGGGVLLAGV